MTGRRSQASTPLLLPVLLAVAATVVALALIATFPIWTHGWGATATTTASYLAIWVPMAIALVWAFVATRRGRRAGGVADVDAVAFGLGLPRFRPADLGWGFAVGLLATAITSVITLALTGSTASGGLVYVPGSLWTAGFLIPTAIIPIFIAPVIEEWFFRGLWLSGTRLALLRSLPVGGRNALAIAISAAVFALMHLAEYNGSGIYTVAALVELLALGVGCGVLVTRTGRLGGAIVAHCIYNLFAVAIAWPW